MSQEERSLESYIKERHETLRILRQICEVYGDNDWSDNLHLADAIEKHLWRNIDAKLDEVQAVLEEVRVRILQIEFSEKGRVLKRAEKAEALLRDVVREGFLQDPFDDERSFAVLQRAQAYLDEISPKEKSKPSLINNTGEVG